MKYQQIEKAIFKERPNRFIAIVETSLGKEVCHVKNTGRCKELLVPGAEIYVERNQNPNRKTALDLITVKKENRLINMDSQAPNKVVKEWLMDGGLCAKPTFLKPESKYKNSRFDFYMEYGQRKCFMEVKGVTLEENGIVRFPDAPTERGVKHLNELCDCIQNGYEAYVMFVIQMKNIERLEPNWKTHPAFGEALCQAKQSGVQILAYDCLVKPDELKIEEPVEITIR